MFGISFPNAKENLGDTIYIFVVANVPLDGVGDVALHGFGVVDANGIRQQAPTKTFAAELAGIKLLETVVSILAEIDWPAKTIVSDNFERRSVASEIHVVEVDVGATVLDMLEIPQGECVIVAHGEEDGTVVATLEVIETNIVDGMAIVAVVVAPVANSQQQRCRHTHNPHPAPRKTCDKVGSANSYPNSERIKTQHIYIVALAGLKAGVVKVEVQDDATEEKQQQHQMKVATPTTAVAP